MNLVLPRDLFNVSNLLKCLGKIHVGMIDGLLPIHHMVDVDGEMEQTDYVDQFKISQAEDGDLFISNVDHYDQRKNFLFLRVPYNSRDPWPLIAYGANEETPDIIEVFHKDGQLTEEFINEINKT